MKKLMVVLALLVAAPLAFAYEFPVGLAGKSIDAALITVMNNLEAMAFKILFALAVLQFVITGYGLLVSGEIDMAMGKFAKMFVWVGFCVWLLSPSGNSDGLSNSGHFIQSSVDGFIALAGSWSATQGSSFNTTDIMLTGIKAYGDITASVAKTTATNAVNAVVTLFVPGVALLTLMMTFAISLVVLVTSAYIALKVFMVKIELSIVVAIAPLSIALLGMTALRDQGFAPFKSMLALIYRIVVLGAVVSGMATISKFLSDYVDTQAFGLMADVWSPLIAAAFGFVLLAFVAHKSDSIASSLANGSASMGSGDVASAAAIGAAVGAAVATGGASVAAGAAKVPQSMAGFMSNLSGGGSVSNASARGAGGATDLLKPDAPLKSMAGSGGNAAPSLPTTSRGAPQKAEASTAGGSGGSKDTGAAMQPGAATQAAPERPKPKSMQALLGDSQNAQRAAKAAGAEPQAAQAAGDAAYAGKSPQDIESATVAAGGTPEQGRAAADAVTGVAPVRPATDPTPGSDTPASGDFASALASDAVSPSPGATSTGGAPVQTPPPAGFAVGEAIAGLPTSNDDLLKAIEKQNAPRKPTTLDRLGNANNHIAQEKAATLVSVNVNAAD